MIVKFVVSGLFKINFGNFFDLLLNYHPSFLSQVKDKRSLVKITN